MQVIEYRGRDGRALGATRTAAARRLVAHGPWRMTMLMQWFTLRHVLGGDPERIRRRYERGTRRRRRG